MVGEKDERKRENSAADLPNILYEIKNIDRQRIMLTDSIINLAGMKSESGLFPDLKIKKKLKNHSWALFQ